MLRHIYNILSILIFLQILGFNESIAQVKVQVVSQKISESVEWKQGMRLELNAERAEIYCTTHPLTTIDFEVTFIAKHENKKMAESDLKKMKWINETLSNKVFLRNYIELTRNESKPESDIKTIYHIKVPEECEVAISNYFGKIEINNLNFKLNITSEFSKIDLRNISGKATIKSTFGDISILGINGDIHIESNRSDIAISNISGMLDLHSILAEVIISRINEIKEIKIDAEKSKVIIQPVEMNRFYFDLDLTTAELEIPEAMKLNFTKNEIEVIKASFNDKENHTQIAVKLNIGSLIIEQ